MSNRLTWAWRRAKPLLEIVGEVVVLLLIAAVVFLALVGGE